MGIFTLGEILNYPAANMLIDKLAPEHMRGTYFGAQTLTNIGHFIGPWIGGFLLVSYGGNTLYVLMAVLTIGGIHFLLERHNSSKYGEKYRRKNKFFDKYCKISSLELFDFKSTSLILKSVDIYYS